MTLNRDEFYVAFILEKISEVESFLTPDSQIFLTSPLHQYAVLHCMQQICDSTKRLSVNLKSEITDIPWQKIADFRNILVHEYMGLEMKVVLEIIQKQLPVLKKKLAELK